MYIVLAQRYHWRPSEIDEMDPDYLEELALFIQAESDHQKVMKQRQEHGK